MQSVQCELALLCVHAFVCEDLNKGEVTRPDCQVEIGYVLSHHHAAAD